MAHDGDDRRTGPEILGLVRNLLLQVVLLLEARLLHLVAELGRNDGRRVEVDGLVDGRHDPKVEEHLDDLVGLEAHLVRHVGNADGVLDAQLALGLLQGLGHGRGSLGLAALAVALAAHARSVVLLLMVPEAAGLEIDGAAPLVALLLALAAAAVEGLILASAKAAHGRAGAAGAVGAEALAGCAAGPCRTRMLGGAASAGAVLTVLAVGAGRTSLAVGTGGASLTVGTGRAGRAVRPFGAGTRGPVAAIGPLGAGA